MSPFSYLPFKPFNSILSTIYGGTPLQILFLCGCLDDRLSDEERNQFIHMDSAEGIYRYIATWCEDIGWKSPAILAHIEYRHATVIMLTSYFLGLGSCEAGTKLFQQYLFTMSDSTICLRPGSNRTSLRTIREIQNTHFGAP